MIGIVDYGLGNLASVAGAVERLGYTTVVSADAKRLREADKLILPGVGAFGDGMTNLKERGLVAILEEEVCGNGKPILGICLGCQLMTRESDEFGTHDGLGWFDTATRRLNPGSDDIRVPHVGWDDLEQTGECVLFDDVPPDAVLYYVHSHRVDPDSKDIVGVCQYGERFGAVLHRDNIYATQFHPEKSQKDGLKVLENFLAKG